MLAHTSCRQQHIAYGNVYSLTLPLHSVLAIQDLQDLIPADLLVFWVAGQTIEDERDATGCGVMAFKHECVHFCSNIFV